MQNEIISSVSTRYTVTLFKLTIKKNSLIFEAVLEARPTRQHRNSVADLDPGSGAFLPPGSGIRDGAMVRSGSGISKQNVLIAFIQK
jgi:hypothetical protein